MSTVRLLLAELVHRRTNLLLGLLAMGTAVVLFVVAPALLDAYSRESLARIDTIHQQTQQQVAQIREQTELELKRMEAKADEELADLDKRTKRIQRDLGFNLRIVHQNTELSQLYANFTSFDMPEEYLRRLAESPEITKIAHLVATLRQMVEWEGQPRLLVGMAPEATQPHVGKKDPMGFQVPPGSVFLGAEAGRNHQVGEEVEILGQPFKVAQILEPNGTREEDIALIMHLSDAQQVLGKSGMISEILALGCKCKTVQRVEEIRAQLEVVLPEAQVLELTTRAVARDQQRRLVESYNAQARADYVAGREKIVADARERESQLIAVTRAGQQTMSRLLEGLANLVMPLLIVVCATWSGLLAWSNVRQRRSEIGLLRSLGKGTASIVGLFLGKALLIGLLAGLVGSGLGLALSQQLAIRWLGVAPERFELPVLLGGLALLGAPLVAAMASYLPTLAAINQDPAAVLMDD